MPASDFIFSPKLADIIDEAFERIGVDPAKITTRHILSARRSLNLMLSYWSSKGMSDWGVFYEEITLKRGQATLSLPIHAYDVIDAALIRDGVSTPMVAMSRRDYLDLPTKGDMGVPDRYFVDRSVRPAVMSIWQLPDVADDKIAMWCFRQYADVGTIGDDVDMPAYFYEAFAAGLASRMSEKFAPAMYQSKVVMAEEAFRQAMSENGSRADLRVSTGWGRRR